MKIKHTGNNVHVSGVDSIYYLVDNEGQITVTIKNCPYVFEAKKIDEGTSQPLQGAAFSLHEQKTVGNMTFIDNTPMTGYENLVTDGNGIIPVLDNSLPEGTYELREIAPPGGYQSLPLNPKLQFVVSDTGEITLKSSPEGVELNTFRENNGPLKYNGMKLLS